MSIERVDSNLCNGCRLCLDTCPMDVFRMDVPAVDRGEYPPCSLACPAGVDMRNYIYLLREGMIEEAAEVLKENLPLAAITGRVCFHPCENECARMEVDEPVNINLLERYTAGKWLEEKAEPVDKIYAAEVAVVGSGPAGLTAAYILARKGYPVSVLEAMEKPGGMLRAGIPDFRLPKDILDRQIAYIKDTGVQFKTRLTVGRDISLEKLRERFKAIFFATGNQLSKSLDMEDFSLNGIITGLDFLKGVNNKTITGINGKVVVIGGGNVAVDAALSALRLGAQKVLIACVESEDQMPAYEEEKNQAVNEGIDIRFSCGPAQIFKDGKEVTGVELLYCTSLYDEKGCFNPVYDESRRENIEADMVILAVGQAPDTSLLPEKMKLTEKGTILVNPVSLETSIPGIFAGGDIVSGPASVIDAIAAGKRAAESIDRHLRGLDLLKGRNIKPKRVSNPPQHGIPRFNRRQGELLDMDKRRGNFDEVKKGFDFDMALLESQRCMTCGAKAVIKYPDDCQLCNYCEMDCPQNAVYVSPEKKVIPIMAFG